MNIIWESLDHILMAVKFIITWATHCCWVHKKTPIFKTLKNISVKLKNSEREIRDTRSYYSRVYVTETGSDYRRNVYISFSRSLLHVFLLSTRWLRPKKTVRSYDSSNANGLHAIGLTILSDAKCQNCMKEGKKKRQTKKTPRYFLLHCLAFAKLRLKHFGSHIWRIW